MSDQLQRKLKFLNHARRQMTEMTYLLERTIHEYISYNTDCKKNHFQSQSPCNLPVLEYKHFDLYCVANLISLSQYLSLQGVNDNE